MTLTLPDGPALQRFTDAELRLELACALYARGRLSAVGGAHLAGLDLIAFQGALRERKIPRQYDAQDLQEDLTSLRQIFHS
jgi:predicted HTH domain antitoxin